MRFARFLVLAIIFGGLLLAGLYFGGEAWFSRPGPAAKSGNETVVLLERGKGVNAIAKQLEHDGVIDNAAVFALWTRIKGKSSDLKAGEYAIPSHASMSEVLTILTTGKSIQHKLTVAEGLTSVQVMRLVNANNELVGDVPDVPPEGSLLPETYLFPRGTTRSDIVSKMRKAHDDLMLELWPKRDSGLPFANENEAVTLASIVEKETALAEERPRVAAVYINRLRRHMLLQSDPSVIYGITKGEPLGRGLRQSELERPTPYNTYMVAGLPPTPIANPGRASIEAVLHPLKTNELYFVARGDGGHVFSSTLEQHQENVRKWRKVERLQNQQNGMPALRRDPVPVIPMR